MGSQHGRCATASRSPASQQARSVWHHMEGKNMQQGFAATTDWRRLACDETRECGNQQPIHVISSSLSLVHALHANGALQQAAGAPMST